MKNHFNLTKSKLLILSIFICLISSQIRAQNNFSIDFGPSWDFPIEKLGNASLNKGFGFEFNINYHVLSYFSVYTGWDKNKFTAKTSFAGSNVDFEETGYVLGLKYIHPIESTKLNYLISAGTTLKHIEVENNAGQIISDTDFGFGWEAGFGIQLDLGKRWNITPSVRMRSLSQEININEIKYSTELRYVSLKIAVGWKF